jgi:hypothetical protein
LSGQRAQAELASARLPFLGGVGAAKPGGAPAASLVTHRAVRHRVSFAIGEHGDLVEGAPVVYRAIVLIVTAAVEHRISNAEPIRAHVVDGALVEVVALLSRRQGCRKQGGRESDRQSQFNSHVALLVVAMVQPESVFRREAPRLRLDLQLMTVNPIPQAW